MKKFLLFYCLFFFSGKIFSQTWAENIAPVLFSKCASCHRPEGIAPFSLLTYTDAFNYRASISNAVATKHMPPWPPDDNYVHFTGARTLSTAEISSIVNWVNNGAPSGNIANAPTPPPPVTNSLGTADVVLKIPNYTSTAATSDIYQCFVLPLRLAADKFVSAIEVVPGNSAIVHHVLVYQDTSANHAAQLLDNASPGPGYTSFGGVGINNPILVDAWVPGTSVKKLPTIFGKRIYPNSDLVVQIHYPKGSNGRLDSTKVRLYYNNNTAARDIRIEPILNHYAPTLINGPLSIPANQTKTFEERFLLPTIVKATVLTVAPHMHLIGQSVKSFAIKPTGDTIHFIDIPHWDFHWQGQYYFQRPVIVDGGSTLKAFATYNNTASNTHNPNSPPQTVNLGEATTDEMMLVYFAFAQYQPGDENIIIDSSLLTTAVGNPSLPIKQLNIFPNPVNTYLQFQNPGQHNDTKLAVWDMAGRKVYEADISHQLFINIPTHRWANGIYRVYLQTKETVYTSKIVVQHK
jgi:hypothetical protein